MAVLMRIYAADDHIMVLTDAVDASFHRHLYVQLSIALDKEFYMEVDGARFLCPGIVLDSQLEHGMDSNRGRQLFLLADRASGLAASLRAAFLEKAGGRYALLPREAGGRIGELLDMEPELWEQAGNYPLLLSRVLPLLGIEDRAAVNRRITDGRVQQTLEALRSGHLTGLTITELARRILLSPSRLSHLFKAETGMPLGSYMALHKLESAMQHLLQHGNATEAAMEAGFDSSSHFAAASKKILGMSATSIRRDSVFLKVSLFDT
jgi:AraC-like DNA-binding protein